jgi:hypothetical protein
MWMIFVYRRMRIRGRLHPLGVRDAADASRTGQLIGAELTLIQLKTGDSRNHGSEKLQMVDF